MSVNFAELLLIILSLVFVVLFIILFIYQTLKQRRHTPHILAAISVALIGGFIYVIVLLTQPVGLTNKLDLILTLTLTIVFYILYLHYEALLTVNPHFWRHSLVISLTSIGVFTHLLAFADLLDEQIINFLPNFFVSGIGVIAFSFAFFVLFTTYRWLKERGTLVELFAISILLATELAFFIDSILTFNLSFEKTPLFSLGELLLIIGMSLLTLNYFINSYPHSQVHHLQLLRCKRLHS
ncbi:MAG: hypothetical protein ACFFBD_29505 [Candidatus Hodarchaeota archaeon]